LDFVEQRYRPGAQGGVRMSDFAFVSRLTTTDPKDGAYWTVQVKEHGDVEISCEVDDPEGGWGKKEEGSLVIPREVFVVLCERMAKVLRATYA
jgi:hypothetical protein